MCRAAEAPPHIDNGDRLQITKAGAEFSGSRESEQTRECGWDLERWREQYLGGGNRRSSLALELRAPILVWEGTHQPCRPWVPPGSHGPAGSSSNKLQEVKKKRNQIDREKKILLLFSCSVVSNSLWPHGLYHARLPYPSPFPRVCSNSCSLSQWCHPSISCRPLLLLPPNLSQHQGLCSPSVNIQSLQWIFRVDFL